MILTAAELEELTQRQRAGAQRRALDAMGIVYLTGPDGRPRVLKALVERMMGEGTRPSAKREPELRF